MPASKHTATPWYCERWTKEDHESILGSIPYDDHYDIFFKQGEEQLPIVIAVVPNNDTDLNIRRISKANAEFIVLACNAHDALVGACKEADHALHGFENYDEEQAGHLVSVARKILKSALRLAGEGER